MEDFVTYEQAVKLKELGFNWFVHAFYNKEEKLFRSNNPDQWNAPVWNEFSAPTLANTQKWLREVKNIIVSVGFDGHFYWYLSESDGEVIDGDIESKSYTTYESALIEGVNQALKLLKS